MDGGCRRKIPGGRSGPCYVNKVEADSVDQIRVEVDAKSPTANTNKDNLRKCHRQGKYTGIITEVYKGTYFFYAPGYRS